ERRRPRWAHGHNAQSSALSVRNRPEPGGGDGKSTWCGRVITHARARYVVEGLHPWAGRPRNAPYEGRLPAFPAPSARVPRTPEHRVQKKQVQPVHVAAVIRIRGETDLVSPPILQNKNERLIGE